MVHPQIFLFSILQLVFTKLTARFTTPDSPHLLVKRHPPLGRVRFAKPPKANWCNHHHTLCLVHLNQKNRLIRGQISAFLSESEVRWDNFRLMCGVGLAGGWVGVSTGADRLLWLVQSVGFESQVPATNLCRPCLCETESCVGISASVLPHQLGLCPNRENTLLSGSSVWECYQV